MRKVRPFTASVSYRDKDGAEREEAFPVKAADYSSAMSFAVSYALQILRLQDFELRMVGA